MPPHPLILERINLSKYRLILKVLQISQETLHWRASWSSMGNCSSILRELGSIKYPEVGSEDCDQPLASNFVMAEGSDNTNLDGFLDASNFIVSWAKEKNKECERLRKNFKEMKKTLDHAKLENDKLRQRIGDDSEMNHRGHQSSSEDTRSRNKRSDVLRKYEVINGSLRRQAMEALGSQPQTASRTELWNRKDLTCRMLLLAYKVAENAKKDFTQAALPRFLQWAPSVAVCCEQNSRSEVSKFLDQDVSEEVQSLLSSKSFNVAASSMLKELAVLCDLTDLEKKMMTELQQCYHEWRRSSPMLPYLDDDMLKNTKLASYVKECLRLAWRMVNLLPPLTLVTADQARRDTLDAFFTIEVEETTETAQTLQVCVWPAVSNLENPNEVHVKGTMAIIPRPKNLQYTY
ncbi:uncharacterized protein [Montipora foliosa]|uniref:uncharacterized protein n=1 Tax=Montipora foliosa TaxID=591990 RepID=UPI0035F18D46